MSKVFWLEFGGVQVALFDNRLGRYFPATFPSATGTISFTPQYRYEETNLDGEIVRKFMGYRVTINLSNIINVGTKPTGTPEEVAVDDYRQFRGLINILNNAGQSPYFGDISIIPKWNQTSANKFASKLYPDNDQRRFRNMLPVSVIGINDAEDFKCYQDVSLTFVSKYLIQQIPNIFDGDTATPQLIKYQQGNLDIIAIAQGGV